MAGRITKRGLLRILEMAFRQQYDGGALPTNFYVALVESGSSMDSDIQTMADVSEISAGNGYTSGGIALTPGATDFDVLLEDASNPVAYIQVKDIAWAASGGTIPASGNPARYAVLTNDDATVANREILAWWDLDADRVVADGDSLSLQDLEVALGTV